MSDTKNVDNAPETGQSEVTDPNLAVLQSDVASTAGTIKTSKTQSRMSSSSERQIKFERAQKCLENAALVSKRIKEHRKATAELLGRPFEDNEDTASEIASTMSERTGYSVASEASTTMSVQDALNIPGISESLANTLKQKEVLMERIKQYKEISKRPMKTTAIRRDSVTDSSSVKKTKDPGDVNQLITTIKEKENALSVVQVKMKAMETTILDLQEKINERDQVIEAKNKATTLMSDSLSKKDKDSVVLLEDTRQQMIKMQENFVNMESEWKDEKDNLLKQIHDKDDKINSLIEINAILEADTLELSLQNTTFKELIDTKNKQIQELEDRLQELHQKDYEISEKEKGDFEEEKGSLEIANMVDLTKKIELLEQLNCQIRQTNKELENKLASVNPESKPAPSSPSKKASPLPTRKGRNTASKPKSPWSNISETPVTEKKDKNELAKLESVIKSLNKDILDKEYVIATKDSAILELEATITQKEIEINNIKAQMKNVQLSVDEKDGADIEVSKIVSESNLDFNDYVKSDESSTEDVTVLRERLTAAQAQITHLNEEIEACNKNMIKVKSNHKLKLKQMQKTIDNFSKVSDANADIVRLNEELHQLSQKVAELEEEKGNLQLHLVDYDSGRLTESDVFKKMLEMENFAETRLKAISVLEAQKFDLVQELHEIQQKYNDLEDNLADMSQIQTDQVSSEMKSVQLEEQIDQLINVKKVLEATIDGLNLDVEDLKRTIKSQEEEKEELFHKLENYIQENMELTDKLEKLSAEKVSSAESIEIVESLTTQERLELEEYNKGISEHKTEGVPEPPASPVCGNTIDTLLEQVSDLNRKIELFTQEREEVMAKMNNLTSENEELHEKMANFTEHSNNLQNNIGLLNNEKEQLAVLNAELNNQIEELKRERIEIMLESVDLPRSLEVESLEAPSTETFKDEKTAGDKGNNKGAKSVKQLTKEILKLKNIIKEREAEIGDCQMKIFALEEEQQKHKESFINNSAYEAKLNSLIGENNHLKEEINNLKSNKDSEEQLYQLKQANEYLQQEIQKLHQEYSATINTRDVKIHELEHLLVEYEKQVFNYGNTVQQKDKELSEYLNQITKLNDVSQKLKSTIEVLEEEKAKDQNAELIKSLNKQISVYQKTLSECEEKLRTLEDEKIKLLSSKGALENKNHSLEVELKKLQESYNEKQNLISELHMQHHKFTEDILNVKTQVKERDEEIHEVKLQLRKESIENEKLRQSLSEKDNTNAPLAHQIEELSEKINNLTTENQQLQVKYEEVESKNKELMEKLKKYALSVKKKATMYNDLEVQFVETQKRVEEKDNIIEQLKIQVETLPALQDKVKYAEEEFNRMQANIVKTEHQKSQEVLQLQMQLTDLNEKLSAAVNENTIINECKTSLEQESERLFDDNNNLKSHIAVLNNKIAVYEVEQKNNMNFVTKISSLESDINLKDNRISELINQLQNLEQQLGQSQFGHDAKVQERDLYIESLETEINKYKNRIDRLEESISFMEQNRYSLERKADQLDSQLQEKQKAYAEFSNQEDHLVSRLAILMDHDRVVEKQLHEIENENRELQYKVQHYNEDNQRLRQSLSDIQEYCNTLVEKASKSDAAEAAVAKYQMDIYELENQLKRTTHEYQASLAQKKHEIEEIESEFNTQIENAIKEKKILNEKYEKVIEHLGQLEKKVTEYRNNIENLNINVDELTKMNQDLSIKLMGGGQTQTPDYTEQYIDEINKLNAIVNSKNQEINELNLRLQNLQTNNIATVANLEARISELNKGLQISHDNYCVLKEETDAITLNNERLQGIVYQKDEQLKQLSEEKTVTFEMNIPKTDGLIISSTIEPFEGFKKVDLAGIESQIVSESIEIPKKEYKIVSSQYQQAGNDGPDEVVEEPIVPKKSYLCYKAEESAEVSDDPFNSEEGWGFEESCEVAQATPGFNDLNDQIQKLKLDNERLKAELDANNSKLLKAMKKLKEFKTTNENLTKELKMAKQMSSSFLDSAIEDELKIKIQDLEKKVEELNTELIKEKRDKESLRKQNEVFHNANDRLTEMKEKLDSDIELWKFKFREVNEKLSTEQWSTDSKVFSDNKVCQSSSDIGRDILKDELVKLESENDELQNTIDHLTMLNKQMTNEHDKLKAEMNELKKQMVQVEVDANNSIELQSVNIDILEKNKVLQQNIQELQEKMDNVVKTSNETYDERNQMYNNLESQYKELMENFTKTQNALESYKSVELEYKNILLEHDVLKLRLQEVQNNQTQGDIALVEKYSALEDYSTQMKQKFDEATNKTIQLKTENQELVKKLKENEEKLIELNAKIERLNSENDTLLSNVAELRSSITSAVDQRGYEIAEIWKQHVAERENVFQETEQELKAQISALEAKYEQLLDNVQSSTQEETNKLVTMEQQASLQNKLQDKEEHLRNLQDKYAEVMSQLDMLRSEIDDEKVMSENKVLTQREEFEKLIKELGEKNQELLNEKQVIHDKFQAELDLAKINVEDFSIHNQALLAKIEELEKTVVDLTNQLRMKDTEIHQKSHEIQIAVAHRNDEYEKMRKQLIEYDKEIEEITYEKEADLAVWRLTMHGKEDDFNKVKTELNAEIASITEALNKKIVECTNLNCQITELNKDLEKRSTNIAEMQRALESQEYEIVTLKDEVASLKDALRSASRIEKHVTFDVDTKPGEYSETSEMPLNKELLDAIPRAELDLALYLLHQRDVRCEELTMELTNLLEERDTLQLRLSDSLRSYEELKSNCKTSGLDISLDSSQETVPVLPSFSVDRELVNVHRTGSRSSSISDLDADKPKLQAKLSELRTVKQSRDVRLRQDSEQRQMDLRMLQRDVANLPPEAVQQLAQAHHTLSRDSQSTSSVLLNWLRGKSTPKVVHNM